MSVGGRENALQSVPEAVSLCSAVQTLTWLLTVRVSDV